VVELNDTVQLFNERDRPIRTEGLQKNAGACVQALHCVRRWSDRFQQRFLFSVYFAERFFIQCHVLRDVGRSGREG
jgi:hypothetical protein